MRAYRVVCRLIKVLQERFLGEYNPARTSGVWHNQGNMVIKYEARAATDQQPQDEDRMNNGIKPGSDGSGR